MARQAAASATHRRPSSQPPRTIWVRRPLTVDAFARDYLICAAGASRRTKTVCSRAKMAGVSQYRDPLSDAQLRAHDRARDLVPEEVWAEALSLLQARLALGSGIVEVGIGSGSYGGRLAARGIQVIGVDINETMLKSAQCRWRDLNTRLVQADATQLPIRDGQVDAVLIAQVLHVVPNWHDVLGETMRILRGERALGTQRWWWCRAIRCRPVLPVRLG